MRVAPCDPRAPSGALARRPLSTLSRAADSRPVSHGSASGRAGAQHDEMISNWRVVYDCALVWLSVTRGVWYGSGALLAPRAYPHTRGQPAPGRPDPYTTRPRGSVRPWSDHLARTEARWRLGELWPRSEALPSLGGASVRSRMVGSGAISLISGGSMKHVVVDVAEEGGIHQIRGRYSEIQRFSSRFSSFVC